MPVTRRLIGIDDALWQRVQDRAAADGRTLIATVGRLLRAGLAGGAREPVMKTAEAQLRQVVSPDNPNARQFQQRDLPRGPSAVEALTRDVFRTLVEQEFEAEQARAAGEHENGRPLSPREIERRRIARQEYLRAHPEEEGQG